MPQPTVVDVKKFFENGGKSVTMTEMQVFWKSLTEEEKNDYRTSLANWDGVSYYC